MDETKIARVKQWLGTGSINIFGPPFSGKDTQARNIAQLLDAASFGGGDIFRHNQQDHELQKAMQSGGLADSDVFVNLVSPFFTKQEYVGKPLVLSTVGRLLPETHVVVDAAKSADHDIKAAVLLNVPEEVIWQHFEFAKQDPNRGQRADDTAEALQIRIGNFAKTSPVLDYYNDRGILLTVDGTKSIDEVTEEIIDALDMLAQRHTA